MSESDLPVNHQEALELAYIKRGESNLARCYIELHEKLAVAPVNTAQHAKGATCWKCGSGNLNSHCRDCGADTVSGESNDAATIG